MRQGREGQGSLEAIIQTEMKSSCKEGEASEGTGRKDGHVRRWEKVIPVVGWQRLQKEQVGRRG